MDEKALKKKKRRTRLLITVGVIVVLLIAMVIIGNESSYKDGVAYWNDGRYSKAMIELHRAGLPHDSQEYVEKFKELLLPELLKFVWCGEDNQELINGNPAQVKHTSWRLWFHEDGTCTYELISKMPSDESFSVAWTTTMYWDFVSTDDNLEIQLRSTPESDVSSSYTCHATNENGQFTVSLLHCSYSDTALQDGDYFTPFKEEDLIIH